MKLAELRQAELGSRLRGAGLRLRTGPVVSEIQSAMPLLAESLALLYGEYPVEAPDEFADFHVRVAPPANLRRWWRPQVQFQFDGAPPFHPLPADQAFPILEWGLNWCVSAHCHSYLVLHAAVVEKRGRAMLLPAPPGSGKSTLCAGLVNRGWRLLSDELALIDPSSGEIAPLARPVSLKNASIDVIRRFAPEAVLSPVVRDTVKGSVAHMQAPAESVRRAAEPAPARWVVLPRYQARSDAVLEPMPRGHAFMQLADSAFNYDLHGAEGFRVLADLVEGCRCYQFTYSDLEGAVRIFDALAEGA